MILIPYRLSQTSCFTVSLKCFSSVPNNCHDVGIGPLLQFPQPLRAGPVVLTLLASPLLPSSYHVLCGSIYSFLVIRYSCLLSANVLHALLCFKVYSWCISGDKYISHPPAPLPSFSSHPYLYTYVYMHIHTHSHKHTDPFKIQVLPELLRHLSW